MRRRGFDAVDDASGALERGGGDVLPRVRHGREVGGGVGEAQALFRCRPGAEVFLLERLGEGHDGAVEVAFDDAVEETGVRRVVGGDRTALEHEVERDRSAREARDALGAARAGHETERDFGETHARVLGREAVVAGEREFEAAAERLPVDGGHDGFRRRLDAGEEVGEDRVGRGTAEFGEIGARGEGAAGGADDDGVDRGVGGGAVETLGKARADGMESAFTGGLSMVRSATRSATL